MEARKRLLCLPLMAFAMWPAAAASQSPSPTPLPRDGIVPGRYIVVLHDAVQDADASTTRIARRHGLRPLHVYRRAVRGFSAALPERVVQRLRSDPDVAFVEPDRWVRVVAQQLPTGVDRIDADLDAVAKIDGVDERVDVDVAVLDTGIDLDHPDLHVVASTNCARSGGCLDGGGDDGHGHGSHVGGIVGALDNDLGVVGVAPGARLWAVRTLDNRGSGFLSWIINGIDWVTAHADRIEVANMSLAWRGYSAAAHAAIQSSVAAGVVYVAAAGNDAIDVYGADGVFGTADDVSPAAFPEVAAISAFADFDGSPGGQASASDDSMASFSNFSRTVVASNPVTSPGAAIDLTCPGVDIRSTYRNAGYAVFRGTSMASPHAAGLAALEIARNGRATDAGGVHAIRQALIDRGVDQTSADGLALPNDPDGNLERLGSAVDPTPIRDIAVSSVVADPSSATPGTLLTVTVEVRNPGTVDVGVDIAVSLLSDNATPGAQDDLELGTRVVAGGLPAGDSVTLTFSWDTTGANVGEHLLRASHDSLDDRPQNDSQTTTVSLRDTTTPAASRIADLDGSSSRTAWWFVWRADVTITVQDDLGQPLSGATVSIRWSDGSTDTCLTNGGGRCAVTGFQWSWNASLALTVTNVSHASLPYDPSLNADPDGDSNGTSIHLARP